MSNLINGMRLVYRKFLGVWLGALSALLLFSAAYAGADEFEIGGVIIDGNQRVEAAAIRQQLKKSEGRISTQEINETVKTLYKTGFFEQVTASIVRTAQPPQSRLRLAVIEKPMVRKVFVRGNKRIDESDLTPILSFDASRFLDKSKVEQLIQRAEAFYKSRGYNDARLEYSVVPVGENQVDITFSVDEGERYKIREISISGLKTVDESDLLGVMQTQRYKWWNSWLFGTGRLIPEMLEADRGLMRQYLLDRGLIDATISEAMISTQNKRFKVSFEVSEGQPYRVGVIIASGDLVEDSVEKTLAGIKSQSSKLFNASSVREDAFRISDKFADVGYAFANVVPNTRVDAAAARVDLDFRVEKGNLVRVRRINISGNDKTYDRVIRRELKVDEQDLYSGKKVRRSQELLQRLGYFEEVNISNEPVQDDQVDLNVNVREGSTGAFSVGAGYSTSDGFLFNIRVAENNVLGSGRRAILNLDLGTERDSYILSFEDRRLNDSYFFGGIDLARTDRKFDDFDRRLTGPAVSLGYPLEELFGEAFEDISIAAKYEWLFTKIHRVDDDAAQLVRDAEGDSTASAVTPRLVRNTINNPLNPTRGSRQELSIELAGLGGDEEFYLAEARHTWYYPLLESSYGNLVFAWRIAAGYGESYNGDPLPLYRRYFPGGINSVRGFKSRTLGPKDENGHEYGGAKQLVNNFDLIFPLFHGAGVNGVLFYDAGEAFDDNRSIDVSDLRQAYGFGLRWNSPIGPMRVEFGFPIGREEGEDSMVTMFSFGAPL